MARYGFRLSIKSGSEEEYRRRHQAVYPELLQAFADLGVETYSIFMDGTILFAYLETDDIERVMRALDAHPANQKWQAYMADMLVPDNEQRTMVPLPEVFYFCS